jgi:hypothetical protein
MVVSLPYQLQPMENSWVAGVVDEYAGASVSFV